MQHLALVCSCDERNSNSTRTPRLNQWCWGEARYCLQDWGEDNEWQPAPSHSSPSRQHTAARALKFGSPPQHSVCAT